MNWKEEPTPPLVGFVIFNLFIVLIIFCSSTFPAVIDTT
jgi:hypothetical protein